MCVYMHHFHLLSRCPYHYILMDKALHQLGTIPNPPGAAKGAVGSRPSARSGPV